MAKLKPRAMALPIPCSYRTEVPKYRSTEVPKKINVLRSPKVMGEILKELCRLFEIELVEGHVMPDHVQMCFGIPPKYSVAQAIGRLKGKSAILIHQKYGRRRNFVGLHFWSRGYCVSAVGLDEFMILNYIRTQEEHEQKDEQLNLDLFG